MAYRPTSCTEAIALFERESKIKAIEAKEVELRFQWPPIERMDGALSTLVACEKLSLSSNMIDRITGIGGMTNLKILVLDRNYIQSLAGLKAVAKTLEQLWISYNCLKKLQGIEALKNLQVLYMPYNHVDERTELNRLQQCPSLKDLVFTGNPLVESLPDNEAWRSYVAKQLQHVTKLDGKLLKRK